MLLTNQKLILEVDQILFTYSNISSQKATSLFETACVQTHFGVPSIAGTRSRSTCPEARRILDLIFAKSPKI